MKPILANVLLVPLACFSMGAGTVYNNTTVPTGPYNVLLAVGEVNSLEHANQINLAGYERIVTNFTLKMRIGGAGAASYKLHVRFYRNDGPGGAPGTLLWSSGPVNAVIDSGADTHQSLAVPSVRVPNSFSYSVQATDRAIYLGASMGPAENNPPTIGSAPFGFWRNLGGRQGWEFVNSNDPPFKARVDANPIPGDLTHDAQVNIDDLVAVVTGWGNCPSPCPPCANDVNGDCTVNIDDLVAVITNWG